MGEVDIKDCTAEFLAELFGCTPRNVLHYVDRGMPVKERGKAGRKHRFNAAHCTPWFGGWLICERTGWSLPRTLATFLLGFFANGHDTGQTFNERQRRAKKAAAEMGFDSAAYDEALDYLLANRMLRW